MEKPITCKYFGNHLDAYLDSELDRATRLKMELHADRCPECGEKLEYMTRLLIMCAEMDEGLSVPWKPRRPGVPPYGKSKPTAPRKYPVARWVGDRCGPGFADRRHLHLPHGRTIPADFIAPNAPVMKAAPASTPWSRRTKRPCAWRQTARQKKSNRHPRGYCPAGDAAQRRAQIGNRGSGSRAAGHCRPGGRI